MESITPRRHLFSLSFFVIRFSLTSFPLGGSIRPIGAYSRFIRPSVQFDPGCQRPTSLVTRTLPQADPPAQHCTHTCKGGLHVTHNLRQDPTETVTHRPNRAAWGIPRRQSTIGDSGPAGRPGVAVERNHERPRHRRW